MRDCKYCKASMDSEEEPCGLPIPIVMNALYGPTKIVFHCTREKGHPGEHVACGSPSHDIAHTMVLKNGMISNQSGPGSVLPYEGE